MARYDYDLIVIGSGAGGGAGAHYAASLGYRVAVVEKDTIGGECPNFACVPTKSLLHASDVYTTVQDAGFYGIATGKPVIDYRKIKAWKDLVVSRTGAAQGKSLFEEDDIDVLRGAARFLSRHEIQVGTRRYTAAKFLIATGSSAFIPPIPGLAESGYGTFKQAVNFEKLPSSIFIMGGGAIGCEFAQIFQSFGAKVYLADALPQLLAKEDEDVSAITQALFEARGITVLTESTVTRVSQREGKKVVHYTREGKEHTETVDEILVATGKRPNTDLGLEKAHVGHDKRGIRVNSYLQTSAPNIYAAGDVVGPYLYTHTGYYQSRIAAHNALSRKKIRPNYHVVPRCVFLDPEIASVGITEREAKEKHIPYRKGMTPIVILGRANTDNVLDGFVKILAKPNGKILGASIVSPRAGEIIHEIALAMQLNAHVTDVAQMIHAYPTYSEAVKIACALVK